MKPWSVPDFYVFHDHPGGLRAPPLRVGGGERAAATSPPSYRRGARYAGGVVRLLSALPDVALQNDPQAVARMRPDAFRPGRAGGFLPGRGRLNFRRSEMVEREVAMIPLAVTGHDSETP